MSEPFLGEIRLVAFNFAPTGWALCNGQTLAISQYAALFSLLGTTYGGNGVNTFQLPNFQSRMPIHAGTPPQGGANHVLGSFGGEATHTLISTEMPAHSHPAQAQSQAAGQVDPAGAVWASTSVPQYSNQDPALALDGSAIGATGGGQAHDNMMPYLCLNFIIAFEGIFPSQG
ncbi:MAG: phage tail protein [Candidatus Binataceae bacterium]